MAKAEQLPRESWVACALAPWAMQFALKQFPAGLICYQYLMMLFPEWETKVTQTAKMQLVSKQAVKEISFERSNKTCFTEWKIDNF